MDRILACIACVAILVTSESISAQDDLPRVLIIGDSIAGMYSNQVSKELKDKVRVDAAWRPTDLVLNSSTVLENLDQLLGRIDRNGKPVPEEKWPAYALIHVNVGLGDLVHRVPNLKSLRLLPISSGGVITTPPDRYRRNLDELIGQLKKKPEGQDCMGLHTHPRLSEVFKPGTEIEYNTIADGIMTKHGVPVNDMYSFVKKLINMDKPAGFGADPFHFDKKNIHMPIIRVIENTFQLPPAPETEEEKIVKQSKSAG